MKELSLKLEAILSRHKEIELKLSDQNALDSNLLIKLNKEYAGLTPLIKKIIDYNKCRKSIDNLQELLNDQDILIRNEAEKELKEVNLHIKSLENELLKSLIPKDINDEKNSILEIRAGTGG